MNEIVPRFEFRAFAQSFGLVEERLRAGRPSEHIRESREVYLVSAGNDDQNVKIRHGTLDVKALIAVEDELEQWRPALKVEFPLAAEAIREQVLPALGILGASLQRETYTLEQLVEGVARPHPALGVAHVFKRRFGYADHSCLSEIVELLVNGAAIQSVAVESEDPAAVRAARRRLGLTEYENLNYPRAIRRILGLVPAGPAERIE